MSINVTLIFPIYSSLNSLNSLINQFNIKPFVNYNNLEIIIINDCSPIIQKTDLKNLINKFPKSLNYKFIFMSNNKGVGEVRNIGILEANSEKYIGFVDDDDTVNLSNFLQISSNYDSDIVISPLTKRYDSKKDISYHAFNFQLILNFLNGNIKTVAWNKLYKINYIKKISAKFSTFRLFEDELFFLKIFFSNRRKKLSFVNIPLVEVNKRLNSRSRSFDHYQIKTYFLVQIENLKYSLNQSFFTFIFWAFLFFPKSMLSFLISYFRSFYNRRILNLSIK